MNFHPEANIDLSGPELRQLAWNLRIFMLEETTRVCDIIKSLLGSAGSVRPLCEVTHTCFTLFSSWNSQICSFCRAGGIFFVIVESPNGLLMGCVQSVSCGHCCLIDEAVRRVPASRVKLCLCTSTWVYWYRRRRYHFFTFSPSSFPPSSFLPFLV